MASVCLSALLWVTGASCDVFDDAEDSTGDMWEESFELSQEFQAAMTHLWQRCAEARGLEEEQFPPTGPFHISPIDTMSDSMGPAEPRVDPEVAAEFGYQPMFPDYLHSDSDYDSSVLEVLYGSNYAREVESPSPSAVESISYVEWDETESFHTEGCVGETYGLVFDDAPGEHFDKSLAATYPLEVEVEGDDEFIETQEQWVECMSEAGYPRVNGYQHTFAVAMSFNRGDDEEFVAEQIALAETDATCAEEHDVDATNLDRFIAALEETEDDNEEALSAYLSHLRGLVDHANELVENDDYPS